jgi:hypothetical protein
MYLATLIIALSVTSSGFSINYEMFAVLHIIYSTGLPIIWINYTACSVEFFEPGRQLRNVHEYFTKLSTLYFIIILLT